MYTINSGDIIQTASLRAKMFREGETKAAMTLDYSAGRGNSFVCLFLGSVKDGTEINPEAILNALGWKFEDEESTKLDELKARSKDIDYRAALLRIHSSLLEGDSATAKELCEKALRR